MSENTAADVRAAAAKALEHKKLNQSDGDGGKKKKKERTRRAHEDLLASYMQAHGVVGETEVMVDTTIDGEQFDANKHFHKLLKEKTLTELLQTDQQLNGEVKKLDSDMKTLVYENYNKFISATDTIRKMKTNVENMEEEMRRLSGTMDMISLNSDRINGTLSNRREKIMQLGGVHNLLNKLQFLVDLPHRLRKCIQVEAYNQAVQAYKQSTAVLRKYEHLPSFGAIYKECQSIINELRIVLQNKLRDPLMNPHATKECMQLLRQIDEKVEQMRSDFLQSRRVYLERQLDSFPSELPDVTLTDHIKQLNQEFLVPFGTFSRTFRESFIDQQQEGNRESGRECNRALEEFARGLLNKYFSLVQNIADLKKNKNEMYPGIEHLYTELIEIHSRLPGLSIGDRLSDNMGQMVHKYIERLFESLHAFSLSRINHIREDISKENPNLGTLAKVITNDIVAQILEVFEQMKPFFHIAAGGGAAVQDSRRMASTANTQFLSKNANNFIARIYVKVQQLFLFIGITFQNFYEDEENSTREPDEKKVSSLLVMAKMCIHLDVNGASTVVQSLTQLKDLAIKQIAIGINNLEVNLEVETIRKQFRASAKNLITTYVRLQCLKLSMMFYKSIDTPNWSSFKEPKAPRAVIEMIIEDIIAQEKEIDQIFDEPVQSEVASPISRHGRVPSMSVVNNITYSKTNSKREPKVDRNKLLTRRKGGQAETKLKFGPMNELSKDNIVMEMIKISFKSLIEYIRTKTFNKYGFQQIQLDTAFIKTILTEYIPNVGPLLKLVLEELVARACEDKANKMRDAKLNQVNAAPASTETSSIDKTEHKEQ
ncbi:hypothetical protein PROFUN_11962 [Planoprotostelium fungivorum]|uniref:Vacuolar protein sorting-associated protein 51 homolog n=1 Tax=Planoprotostelium fungivorum TaxID=1890364 RepID=A0A2P6N8Y2_9EUKA|nr:hypothetical protein PROFUN_11962 [Planoprotostelium fungivorum]